MFRWPDAMMTLIAAVVNRPVDPTGNLCLSHCQSYKINAICRQLYWYSRWPILPNKSSCIDTTSHSHIVRENCLMINTGRNSCVLAADSIPVFVELKIDLYFIRKMLIFVHKTLMYVSVSNKCGIPPVAAHTKRDDCMMIHGEKTACHYTCEPGFVLSTGESGQFIFCIIKLTGRHRFVKEWEKLSPCEGKSSITEIYWHPIINLHPSFVSP